MLHFLTSFSLTDSDNYHKTRLALAKLHEHINNQRHDWQHKITRKLVDESQAICIEDLRSSFMFHNRRLGKASELEKKIL
ncbi:transposase [Escherichia coli]|uniref:transposase n=1 Tax=Escherichia coli TaxID=562 RepID=UPI0015D51FF0|nr:hypothetical protein [Escherichia coli]